MQYFTINGSYFGARRLQCGFMGRSKGNLGEFLDDAIGHMAFEAALVRDHLVPVWRRVAAEAAQGLAEHSTPVRYHKACLHILADSPVWAAHVRHRQQHLLKALRLALADDTRFAGLDTLRIKSAPRAQPVHPGQGAGRAHTPRTLSPESRKSIEAVASDIDDAALRAALERLARNGS